MRTDPRLACANAEERAWWAFLHDAVCHPLMALTNWAGWAVRFHDWTSHRAWPREPGFVSQMRVMQTKRWGAVEVTHVMQGGFYSIQHPNLGHKVVTKTDDFISAAEFAEQWFDGLAEEFGGRFNPS